MVEETRWKESARGLGQGVVGGPPHHAVVVVDAWRCRTRVPAGAPVDGEQGAVVDVGRGRSCRAGRRTCGSPPAARGSWPTSNGGSTQLRTTARSPSSSPMTRAEAGTASAEASATSPAPTASRPQPGGAAVHGRRRPPGAQRQPAQGQRREHGALDGQGLRVADAEQDHRGQHGGEAAATGSSAASQAGAGAGGPASVPSEPGDQPEQPRQHEQRTVAVDGRQRGEQVLPAEERLVDEPGERRAAGERRRCRPPSAGRAVRRAGRTPTARMTTGATSGQPAARVRWVTTTATTAPSMPTTRKDQPVNDVARPLSATPVSSEHEGQVDQRVRVGDQRWPGRGSTARSGLRVVRAARSVVGVIGGSRGAGRRGLPWRRGGGRGGPRSR